MLEMQLGDKINNIEKKLAEFNMDLCGELGIKTIPALVLDDDTVVFGIDEIARQINLLT